MTETIPGTDITIVRGDSILFCDQELEAGSVDLCLTDPPYKMDYQTNHRSKTSRSSGDREDLLSSKIKNDVGPEASAFLRRYAKRLYKITKDGGALYWFCKMEGDDGEDLLSFMKSCISKAGWQIKNTIIWMKDNWTAGDLDGAFGFQYECIIYAHKGRHLRRGYRYPDIWPFDRVPDAERIHPHQKPLGLLGRAIECSSDEGDLIFDGCAGSGSTGLAAQNLGRRSILVEYDQKRYAAMHEYLINQTATDLFTTFG